MTIDDLIEEFSFLEEQEEKYRYLIELGKELPPMGEELKTPERIVEGCMSQVWLHSELYEENGEKKLRFLADSDAIIVRGLIAVLLVSYNEKTAQEIVSSDMADTFEKLGLHTAFSMNRRNGFFSMVKRIHAAAESALS